MPEHLHIRGQGATTWFVLLDTHYKTRLRPKHRKLTVQCLQAIKTVVPTDPIDVICVSDLPMWTWKSAGTPPHPGAMTWFTLFYRHLKTWDFESKIIETSVFASTKSKICYPYNQPLKPPNPKHDSFMCLVNDCLNKISKLMNIRKLIFNLLIKNLTNKRLQI